MAQPNTLPQYSRYITTHNEEGLSVFSDHDPTVPKKYFPGGSTFTLDYTTSSIPVSLTANADSEDYDANLARHESIGPTWTAPNGTTIRHVEMAPGNGSPMHRTLTLDYMVVLEGEVDLTMDSGEVRSLKCGDTIVQRGTMHAWKNRSETKWVRMVCVMLPLEEGWEINGKVAKEEFQDAPAKEGK